MNYRYVKRPIEVEAIQITSYMLAIDAPLWFQEAIEKGVVYLLDEPESNEGYVFGIRTKEGTMLASHGDYIIKGIAGELYPCDANIFEDSYDPVL